MNSYEKHEDLFERLDRFEAELFELTADHQDQVEKVDLFTRRELRNSGYVMLELNKVKNRLDKLERRRAKQRQQEIQDRFENPDLVSSEEADEELDRHFKLAVELECGRDDCKDQVCPPWKSCAMEARRLEEVPREVRGIPFAKTDHLPDFNNTALIGDFGEYELTNECDDNWTPGEYKTIEEAVDQLNWTEKQLNNWILEWAEEHRMVRELHKAAKELKENYREMVGMHIEERRKNRQLKQELERRKESQKDDLEYAQILQERVYELESDLKQARNTSRQRKKAMGDLKRKLKEMEL